MTWELKSGCMLFRMDIDGTGRNLEVIEMRYGEPWRVMKVEKADLSTLAEAVHRAMVQNDLIPDSVVDAAGKYAFLHRVECDCEGGYYDSEDDLCAAFMAGAEWARRGSD